MPRTPHAYPRETLDGVWFELCISLLDRDLKADLFDSVIVGFLAVLGIDPSKRIFKEACHLTSSSPSGFFKIVTILIIRKAVIDGRDSEMSEPADLLDGTLDRFLIIGVRSPLRCVDQLRMYEKKIRNSTTCLGYVSWSHDSLSIFYKGIRDLISA